VSCRGLFLRGKAYLKLLLMFEEFNKGLLFEKRDYD
jgi:hypothetical protein